MASKHRSTTPKRKAKIVTEEKEHQPGAGPSPAPGGSTIKDGDVKQHPASGPHPAHGSMKYQPGWPGVEQTAPITQGHMTDSPTNTPHARRPGELAAGHPTSPYPLDAGPSRVSYLNNQSPMRPAVVTDVATVQGAGPIASSIADHQGQAKLSAMHQRDAASPFLAQQLGARAPQGSRGVARPADHTAPLSPANEGIGRDGGGASHIPVDGGIYGARPPRRVPPPGAEFGSFYPARSGGSDD